MADFSCDFRISYGPHGGCRIDFRCFDTPNSITAYGCAEPDYRTEDLLIGIFRECLEYHRLWSFSLSGSDVSRVNEPVARVPVDPRTARLIAAMRGFHDAEPLFDFTIGPVSYLWKHARHVPPDGELRRALALVGARRIALEGDVVVKDDPLMQVDVGGAAKGFVADEVAARLRDAGVTCADIDLGGNLFLMGRHPEGRAWRVSVRIPEGVRAPATIVEVADRSVVTSGSYERFAEIGGKRYQHIIDPRTGWPSTSDVVSATVIAESSLQADLLATTALLVGSQGFDALAARHPETGFLAITENGQLLRSPHGA